MGLQMKTNYDSRIEKVEFSRLTGEQQRFPEVISPIIVETLALVKSSIEVQRSLIITTPSKDSFGQVLATLLALDSQLELSKRKRFFADDVFLFSPGERLKLGNAIVEFIRVDDKTGQIVVKYDIKKGIRHYLSKDHALLLQRTDSSRRLSPEKTVNAELAKLDAETDLSHPLQKVFTFSESTIVVVGPLNRARSFFTDTYLNNRPLNTVLLCSQIDYDDQGQNAHYASVGKGQYSGIPALASAMDLLDVVQLDDTLINKVKAIIIDVDNYSHFFENNVNELRLLQKKGIPLFAIVSNANYNAADFLRDEGFLKWCWDSRTFNHYDNLQTVSLLRGNNQQSFFFNFNQRCMNSRGRNIQITSVDDSRISAIFKSLTHVDMLMSESVPSSIAEDARVTLWRLFLVALRTQAPFIEVYSDISDSLASLHETLTNQRSSFSLEVIEAMWAAVDEIEELYSSRRNEKGSAIYKAIKESAVGGNITLVVKSSADCARAQRYWSQYADDLKGTTFSVRPFSEVKATRRPIRGRLIVVGWLGRDRMSSLLKSGLAEIVQMVLYKGCETAWYIAWDNAFKKTALNSDDSERVLSELKIRFTESLPALPQPQRMVAKKSNDVVEETEVQWRKRVYARHEAKGAERSSSVKAIPVHFAGDFVAFYRENSRLTDVTDVIEGGTQKAKTVRVGDPEGLRSGSFILMKEADRDLIEQLADRAIGSDSDALRKKAGAWREALERLYRKYSYDEEEVYQVLSLKGMNKGFPAFRGLRRNPDRISPGNSQDEITDTILAIARSLPDFSLQRDANEIAKAGMELQNQHRLAGRRLSKTLAEVFSKYMSATDLSKPNDIWDPVNLEIEELGNVKLCRILDIDRDDTVLVLDSKTNRLLEE